MSDTEDRARDATQDAHDKREEHQGWVRIHSTALKEKMRAAFSDGYAEGRADALSEQCGDPPPCVRCNGSGDMEATAGAGPDAYTVTVPCAACGGTGA